ncbi:hypothetical protein PVK06_040532 [Gossypium arboreum]|uniref:Uncharacterized protein n=1 Tax=Gossypium arboreum TaxID=29729 RepID=A0ABR0N7W4_GOSAR|nr:hypothetical protein PVK06_040532 [Gossypium arboreum]
MKGKIKVLVVFFLNLGDGASESGVILFYSQIILADLPLDDNEEEILQAQKVLDFAMEEYEFCLVGCFLISSVTYFSAMRRMMANL